MYHISDYPDDWKSSFVLFINKPDGESLRPITLTSCVCKFFETLLKNRLQWWLEANNSLPISQTGFRKGQSCIDNITDLTLKIENSFKSKQHTLATFLDISSAFDNVNCEVLLSILASYHCPEHIIKFIKFITHERLIHNEITGQSHRKTNKGVPQGGVLSPVVYNVHIENHRESTQERQSLNIRRLYPSHD